MTSASMASAVYNIHGWQWMVILVTMIKRIWWTTIFLIAIGHIEPLHSDTWGHGFHANFCGQYNCGIILCELAKDVDYQSKLKGFWRA